MRTRDAIALLRRVYRGTPPAARVHVAIRFLTCPFPRMLDVLPESGRVLELGAGHGIYAYLAAANPRLRVFAVEPDLRKSLPPHAPGVRWIAAFDDAIRGAFDAILVADVVYLLTLDERVTLYRRIYERLAPGGTFVLKELDPARGLKIRWARLQESLNNAFLHVTLGRGFVYQTREELEATLRAIGFTDFAARRIDRGYPHPHILYTARKPL
ncbi:MAG: class I SAM-dependent methyltransferase [Acidobacteria bacterium]|nr:class I SAM-dependent methyltransferase [Acidobacteriota bacterium]MBV9476854.1 class I SAM-dependent methyltransferase [Acidobacteriota bacterium]